MNRITFHITRLLFLGLILISGYGLTSCDSFIYDDEGDCDPYYKVRFVYDMNMKFADAFPQEVNELTLYVVDNATGSIVWSTQESGEALKADGYTVDVPVNPGCYTLLAWAGEGHTTHFEVADANHYKNLQCSLLRERDSAGEAHVNHDLNRLYHGRLDAQDFPESQGVHIYTVPLVKNTNDFHIVLQHISGEPVDADAFTYEITDNNGLMDWDNSLMPDEQLHYHAWETRSGVASIVWPGSPELKPASRVQSQFSAAVAELTTARMVKGQDMRLTIREKENNETVLSVPVIDYCLLVKGRYDRVMTDQEYLDRQDDYSMVFFLDSHNRWVNTQIYINSWHVIFNNSEL